MEREFNEKESLQLINSMIAEARNNVSKGDGNSLLFVGYSLVVIALLNALLLYVLTPSYLAYNVWLLMLPVTFIVFWIANKQDREVLIRTHIDKIVGSVWKGFVWAILLVMVVLSAMGYVMKSGEIGLLTTPIILILTGLAQYIAGIACKYKPFVRGGLVFWVGALLCILYFYFMQEPAGQYVIFALSVIGGFIIPGHMINRKAEV